MADDRLDLTAEERNELLDLARRSLEEHVRTGHSSRPDPDWLARRPRFHIARGVFVTLEEDGRLRGCIGELAACRPLHEAVTRATVEAAAHDTRFPPVSISELEHLVLSITVLDEPVPIEARNPDELLATLEPGVDGVVLEYEGRRSTFLPQVWKHLPDPREFLGRLSRKQGARADAWRSPDALLFRYRAVSFGEPGSSK